ncbi:MAG: hypothetical protein AMJ78_10245 [Omnitrophica WOR_2 bacterium SM23_29]|nr:MAG: hypothetical protein AMJ78_10245 [Omnitrophica WOR_2 bacterium SM23_29]
MEPNKRRKKFIGTPLQRNLLIVIFTSAVVPAVIVGVCLYHLIFNTLAWYIGRRAIISYNLTPVLQKIILVVLISMPIALLIIWIIALELSHRIAGPLFRIEKELDARIAGETRGPIKLRKKDEFKLLADKINKLISK